MKRSLKILLWSSILTDLAGGFLGPIYAIFVEEIGGNIITAGSSFALFSIVSGILIFIMGKMEDKIQSKEKMLVIGRMLSIVGYLGYFFVTNPTHLFIVQVIPDVDMVKGKTTLVRTILKNSATETKNINVSLYFEGVLKDTNNTLSIDTNEEIDVDLWFVPDSDGDNKQIKIEVKEN